MRMLLLLLGIGMVLIGFFVKTSRPSPVTSASRDQRLPLWLARALLLGLGAVLIIAGMLFRIHRY